MCVLANGNEKGIQFYRTRKKAKNKNCIQGSDRAFFTCCHFVSLICFPHLTFECCYRPFNASLTMQTFLINKKEEKRILMTFLFIANDI